MPPWAQTRCQLPYAFADQVWLLSPVQHSAFDSVTPVLCPPLVPSPTPTRQPIIALRATAGRTRVERLSGVSA